MQTVKSGDTLSDEHENEWIVEMTARSPLYDLDGVPGVVHLRAENGVSNRVSFSSVFSGQQISDYRKWRVVKRS